MLIEVPRSTYKVIRVKVWLKNTEFIVRQSLQVRSRLLITSQGAEAEQWLVFTDL